MARKTDVPAELVDVRCFAHPRRQAWHTLLGVGMCDPCAHVGVRAVVLQEVDADDPPDVDATQLALVAGGEE
jgi:hypothetical protein